jgi:hypothetical protein
MDRDAVVATIAGSSASASAAGEGEEGAAEA